jgi:hypothetical protein
LVVRDESGQAVAVIEDPNLTGLPDWVTQCYIDTKFFVSCDDDYSGLWIALPIQLPYEHDKKGVAMRTAPTSLLLYDEDERFIRVLAETEY